MSRTYVNFQGLFIISRGPLIQGLLFSQYCGKDHWTLLWNHCLEYRDDARGMHTTAECAWEEPTLTCHHTHELVLKDVFYACFEIPTAPEMSLFKQSKNAWPFLEQRRLHCWRWHSALDFFIEDKAPRQRKDDMINYFQGVVTSGEHPQEDYRELLP